MAGAVQPRTSGSGQRSAEPLRGGAGWQESAARAERSGAGAFRVRPLGGGSVKARRSRCSSALPSRRGVGTMPGSPAVRGGSPAAQRPCERGFTDRSADRCADWCTDPSVRARAFNGPDAAEASPRRWASWRSRGRWRRRPSARATERPYRLSAVENGLLTAARPDVSGTPLGRESRPPATARRQRRAAPARGALRRSLGRPRRLGPRRQQGVLLRSCPHALGKKGRTGGRTPAIRGPSASCLLG